jgi:hypothetical protein
MEDLKSWSIKILLPALVALSIKLAVQSKKTAISWFNVITSFITGIGSAYLFSDWVISTISQPYIPIAIAIITISGEKIGFYLVYKFNVESFLTNILQNFKKTK